MELKKYLEKKIFVTGVSGSGKTTFSIKYSEIFNFPYFDFELNWGGYGPGVENQFDEMIKKYPEEFITDAIPYTVTNDRLDFLNYYAKNDDIKIICLCCTNEEEFNKRIELKSYSNKNQAYKEFYHFYFVSLKKYYTKLNIEYYDSFTNKYISEDELYERIDWVIKYNLLDYINTQEYDKFYQDIECIDFIGYTASSKTWDNIKDLIDWRDKRVADLGCFHCYFGIKAAKLGAIVTGMDINNTVLKTAKYINELEGNIITLRKWAGGEEVSSNYDITLCLNVLHHFADVRKGLQNIKSKIVIFETNTNLVDIISQEFKIIREIKSHRTDYYNNERIILLAEKKC